MMGRFLNSLTLLTTFLLVGCASSPKHEVIHDVEEEEPVVCHEIQLNSHNIMDFTERNEIKKWELEAACKRIGDIGEVITVSPGSGLKKEEMDRLRDIAKNYDVEVPSINFQNTYDLSCSNSKEKRLQAFIDAANSNRKVIWAIRGGFGTEMLLADLNKITPPGQKKTFIGFCDSTSINIFLYQNWGWRVIHAPVFMYLLNDGFSLNKFDRLLDILEGKLNSYDISPLKPFNKKAQFIKNEISGTLTGGNLTLVESSLGTCWEIKTDDKILFLEDAHERAGSIYRSLYHLKEAGKLNNVRAIVLGTFLDGGSQKIVKDFLKRFASTLKDIPVYTTNQIGHGYHNAPIIYGADATIRNGKMTIYVDHSYDLPKKQQNSENISQNSETISAENVSDKEASIPNAGFGITKENTVIL